MPISDSSPININNNTSSENSALPPESKSSLPGKDDHCLACDYPLRNLKAWRCPECNCENSAAQRAELQKYLRNPWRFAIKCVYLPIALMLGASAVLTLVAFAATWLELSLHSFISMVAMMSIPYSLCHLGILIGAAARVTQIQLMRRHSPFALKEKPIPALFTFCLHFSWLSIVPIIFVSLIWSYVAPYFSS